MANREQESPSSSSTLLADDSPSAYCFVLRIMSKRRNWVCLFASVYAALLFSSWNILKSILSWYEAQISSSSSWWPALYASLLLGALFVLYSTVAALAVAVPATMVIWVAVVVLLAFCGKPRKELVVEGRKITVEILHFVVKVLLKEGNIVAAGCAVLGYFVLVYRNTLRDL